MSGAVPGFVDVMLNFDTAELTDDNILLQLRLMGKKLVFYGDDTWIRLFPGLFTRSDGTTSFFVTDYTEVCLWFCSVLRLRLCFCHCFTFEMVLLIRILGVLFNDKLLYQ